MFMENLKESIQAKLLRILQGSLNKDFYMPLAVLVGFLLGITCMIALAQSNVIVLFAKQYAYVDVERVINEVNNDLLDQIKSNKIDDTEVEVKLTKAKTRFDNLLANYTRSHNTVVFSSTKVISGAEEITDYFISHLKEVE